MLANKVRRRRQKRRPHARVDALCLCLLRPSFCPPPPLWPRSPRPPSRLSGLDSQPWTNDLPPARASLARVITRPTSPRVSLGRPENKCHLLAGPSTMMRQGETRRNRWTVRSHRTKGQAPPAVNDSGRLKIRKGTRLLTMTTGSAKKAKEPTANCSVPRIWYCGVLSTSKYEYHQPP